MQNLLKRVETLKQSSVKHIIDSRLKEFKSLKDNRSIFNELCFCLLTANYSAEKAIVIQQKIGNGFLNLSEDSLRLKLKELGYRYPNIRSSYIIEARKHYKKLEFNRDWLVKNVKGLGMKESSHFLRNIGYDDYAIIDFHIIDLLVDNQLITRPNTITPKKYIEIENVLKEIGSKLCLSLAELDLYLWYIETGKVLK